VSGNLGALNLDVETEAAEQSDFAPLPDGIYSVVMDDSQLKANKNNAGQHLAFRLQVIDGAHNGRLIWGNINVQNPNATAEKIGRGQLAAICKAVGIMNPQDSAELHDKPFKVKLGLRKDDATRNEPKAFFPIDYKSVEDAGDAADVPQPPAPAPRPAAAPRAAPAARPAAPAAGVKKPWQK